VIGSHYKTIAII